MVTWRNLVGGGVVFQLLRFFRNAFLFGRSTLGGKRLRGCGSVFEGNVCKVIVLGGMQKYAFEFFGDDAA